MNTEGYEQAGPGAVPVHKLYPWVLLDTRRLEGPEVSKVAPCTVELQLPIPDVKRLRQPVGGLAYLCALSTAPGAQAEVAAYMQLQSLTHRQIEEQLQPGCGVQANSPGSSTLSLHKGGCWNCSLRPIHVHEGLQTSVYGRRMGDNARWIEAAENPEVSLCFCHFGHGATVHSHVWYNNPAAFFVIYPTVYRRGPSISATPLQDRGKPAFLRN